MTEPMEPVTDETEGMDPDAEQIIDETMEPEDLDGEDGDDGPDPDSEIVDENDVPEQETPEEVLLGNTEAMGDDLAGEDVDDEWLEFDLRRDAADEDDA